VDRQRLGDWGTFLFATAAAIGVIVQVFLIGAFIFGEDALDLHKECGKVVHGLYVLTFIAAIIGAWPNWRRTAWPFGLAVLGSIQAFLAGGGDDVSGWVHAFHAALVPLVFLIAVWISWNARGVLGKRDTAEAPG